MKVTLEMIRAAQDILRGYVEVTPMLFSQSSSQRASSQIFLKMENLQRTGSFKARGAYVKIHSLSDAEKKQGIIASSAGNHAQGVALAAREQKVLAHIVMPTNAPLVKIQATQSYGAQVILQGDYYDQAFEHAKKLAQEKNYVFVHPYQDEQVIAGQGTLGLEVYQQLPDIDTIVVPVGGGGLISGVAIAIKSMLPKCRVLGVQAQGCPAMTESFQNKKIVEFNGRVATIADGIAVKKPSLEMYENFISKYVDDMITVTDDEIAESMVWLMERSKAVVEGSGAAALAAAMSGRLKLGQKTCVIVSGGNVDMNMIEKVIESGLRRSGRLAKMTLQVEDIPGSLSRITKAIADLRGNILQIHHDRVSKGLYLKETYIEVWLETNSEEHIQQIRQALMTLGVRVL